MLKRMIIMLIAVGLVLGGIFGFQIFKNSMIKKYMAAGSNVPSTVSTTTAMLSEWQPELKAVGNLKAVKGVDLAAEVSGIVEEIHFNSDEDVQEGTMLVQLRYSQDAATLHALEASAKLAEITLQRDQKLLQAQATSQATVDVDTANLASTKAQVSAQRAVIEKKIILAPFSGRLGIRTVDVGQFLNAGVPVVTLQQLDPIFIDFYLPQQSITKLQVGQKVTAKNDAFPDMTFEGQISAINAKVDPSTRNILVRSTFKNPDKILLPGMYSTVLVATGGPEQRLTLPQTAITYNPYGNTVFVIDENGKNAKGESAKIAKQTFVTTGETRGDQVEIINGLKEGDIVVTAGQIKLRNGSAVIVNNEIQPSNDENPKPEDK